MNQDAQAPMRSPTPLTPLPSARSHIRWTLILLGVCALLSAFTVYDHAFLRLGRGVISRDELHRLEVFLAGDLVDPWQYRILSNYVAAGFLAVARLLHIPMPEVKAFVIFRILQNFALFYVVASYWTTLGLRRLHTLAGLAVLAWGFQNANYESGLSFSTWADITFYVLAAIAVANRRFSWAIPIVLLAALNQETSGLIPFLVVSATHWKPAKPRLNRRILAIAATCLLIYLIVFAALRLGYGPRPHMHPFDRIPGIDLFRYNFSDRDFSVIVFSGFSIFPLVALPFWKKWPLILRRFFWVLVPPWLVINLFLGVIAEARILMVPYVLVLLPAALLVIQGEDQTSRPLTVGLSNATADSGDPGS